MKIVKENISGIRWSGKDPTKAPIIGKLVTKKMDLGGYTLEPEEYDVVEILENGDIFMVNSWYKPGVPQLIHKEMVDKYVEI